MGGEFLERALGLSRGAKRPDGSASWVLDDAALLALGREYAMPLREVCALCLDAGLAPERYLRNQETVSLADQALLARSQAVVCGLGGLGGHVLDTLCRLGLGRIRAADGDRFEASNLNRQLLAETGTLGHSKAQAALERAHRVNPAVDVEARNEFWAARDMPAALDGAQVALDCLGGLEHRLALARAASGAGVPLVTAAVAGLGGYVATVLPGAVGPAELLGSGPAAEDSLGCLAPAVALAANLQCAEALRILTGKAPALAGKMLVFDLADMTFQTMDLG